MSYRQKPQREYNSSDIAKALRAHCIRNNLPYGEFDVNMKYTRQVSDFIRRIEEAHEATKNSKLVFKCEAA